MTPQTTAPQLENRVSDALKRIASVRTLEGRTVMNVPVMYPSGATTTVEIEMNGGNCWVSDMGHGLVEAKYMGAQDFYAKAARDIATQHGVQFDGNSIFALWVPVARLEASIVCVANSSCQAAQSAMLSASEQNATKKNDQIFERIKAVFGESVVSKSVEIHGRHAHWDAKNVVIFPNRRKAIFEFMTSNPISVSSKFLMFADILKADDGVSLNAVVSKANNLNSKGQMIADVANVIEFSATDEQFIQVAKAS